MSIDLTSQGTSEKKVFKYDVCLMRLVLIVLLVVHHAFIIFARGWPVPDSFPQNRCYCWISVIAVSFMLMTFVFISGFVFGMSHKNNIGLKELIIKKAKRLLIPSIVFSIFYFALFGNKAAPAWEIAYRIINGAGHLWFLPMLFWCFPLTWLIEKSRLNPKIAIILLFLLTFFSKIFIPFRLNFTLYYLLVFYIGYIITSRKINLEKYITLRNTVICTVFYILMMFLSGNYLDSVPAIVANALSVSRGLSGTAMIYLIFNLLINHHKIKPSSTLINLSNLCFGVYIYQEFILKILYYKFGLIYSTQPDILPWIGLAVTLPLSLLLTYLTRKTRIGRKLM